MCDVPVVAGRARIRNAQLPALLREGRGWTRAVHGAQGPTEDARHDLSKMEHVGETVIFAIANSLPFLVYSWRDLLQPDFQ